MDDAVQEEREESGEAEKRATAKDGGYPDSRLYYALRRCAPIIQVTLTPPHAVPECVASLAHVGQGWRNGATTRTYPSCKKGDTCPFIVQHSRHRRPCFRERSGVRLMRTMSGPPDPLQLD
jgi:hypothetical protein